MLNLTPKETVMQYKTIVLELLQDRPQMYDQLRSNQKLLSTLERYASELKTNHEAWKERLVLAKPGSDLTQIAAEALELALEQLERRLPAASPVDATEPLSLDAAMASISRHTPSA
jgi:hypothetical protein